LGDGVSDALPSKEPLGPAKLSPPDVEIALRIKQLLYEEMFTIARRKKNSRTNCENTKLKIVHPEPKSPESERSDAPGFLTRNELDSIESSIRTCLSNGTLDT
jgi:hypothetical protein